VNRTGDVFFEKRAKKLLEIAEYAGWVWKKQKCNIKSTKSKNTTRRNEMVASRVAEGTQPKARAT
jgi:hypothetical protein